MASFFEKLLNATKGLSEALRARELAVADLGYPTKGGKPASHNNYGCGY